MLYEKGCAVVRMMNCFSSVLSQLTHLLFSLSLCFFLFPSPGLLYCVEYLEKNLAWLKKAIKEQPAGKLSLFIHMNMQCITLISSSLLTTEQQREERGSACIIANSILNSIFSFSLHISHVCVILFNIVFILSDSYYIFDLPGQVELYTHHPAMKKIVTKLTEKWGMKVSQHVECDETM